jgi:hypothetical protein
VIEEREQPGYLYYHLFPQYWRYIHKQMQRHLCCLFFFSGERSVADARRRSHLTARCSQPDVHPGAAKQLQPSAAGPGPALGGACTYFQPELLMPVCLLQTQPLTSVLVISSVLRLKNFSRFRFRVRLCPPLSSIYISREETRNSPSPWPCRALQTYPTTSCSSGRAARHTAQRKRSADP